jgi:thiol-disulfide isomerase/thioredoxin
MKKTISALFAVLCCHLLFAQPTRPNQPATDPANAQAPFMRFPTLPPLHLLKLDSMTYLTKDDVKRNRRAIIMFFSPDCPHCKEQTERILEDFKDFKDMEIVMATYQPFSELKEFNEHYHLADHPNIMVGRDEHFTLPPFYKIKNMPYIALYDKKGNLITTFEGTQKVDTLLQAFKEGRN